MAAMIAGLSWAENRKELAMADGFRGIPGVPEGWELVGIGCEALDWSIGFLDGRRVAVQLAMKSPNSPKIRKIEQPKRYRPFANGEEFKPHRERWWRMKSESKDKFRPPAYYSGSINWERAFELLEFDDGSPYGVEVTDAE
jgi:hypothetical protein